VKLKEIERVGNRCSLLRTRAVEREPESLQKGIVEPQLNYT
jgi:hypothetical protein